MTEITLTKGGITVIVYTQEITENLTNKLFQITPPQTKQQQELGPKEVKTIDLLRITKEWQIKGELTGTSTKSAKEVKDELKSIFNGAGTNGGEITLTYDGDSITGFIERLMFTERTMDIPSTEPEDLAKYTIQLTFLGGIQI